MKISILDDYHDTLRTLDCFAKLSGRPVWTTCGSMDRSRADACLVWQSRDQSRPIRRTWSSSSAVVTSDTSRALAVPRESELFG